MFIHLKDSLAKIKASFHKKFALIKVIEMKDT